MHIPRDVQVVSTTLEEWYVTPDVIGEGVSEQHVINKAICEGKGATYDGVDCVGELNDSEITVSYLFLSPECWLPGCIMQLGRRKM